MSEPNPTRACFDVRCFNCKRKYGWIGKMTDRPPCPGCGANLSPAELLDAQNKIERLFAEIDNEGDSHAL